ncbi:sugar-transfer associated ATP-grasp domain-containing protein [Carboxylicivirga sp. RSCT41]|uniref:sugar-transfer associated ATP-grasp domain-containing protein n=1 Tax=Carboxylicivirga agarovorans TaxID=3417570 RepID=UPI003D32AFA4
MSFKYQMLRFLSTYARKAYRVLNYEHFVEQNIQLAKKFKPKNGQVLYKLTSEDLKNYKKKWGVFGAGVKDIHVRNASGFLGYFDENIVPSDVYFAIIEPLLNNRKFALAYEDKARIDWINKPEHIPAIYVRNINGVYYSNDKKVLQKQSIDFDGLLTGVDSVVIKKTIEIHGGKGVEMFDRNKEGQLVNDKNEILSLDLLEQKFKKDFLVQKTVEQHPFYKAFNPSSLNTFRVYTYRSVTDNQIHILYSFLRIGAEKSRVDNIANGGVFVCLKEGRFIEKGMKIGGVVVKQMNGLKPFKEMGTPPFIDEVYKLAKELAASHYYCRILGFDLAIDAQGKVMHIETNTSDIGMEGLQCTLGPLFHEFTDEIIEYCKTEMKPKSKYSIYGS